MHIFDPTLDRAEIQEVESADSVEFHHFGLGNKDARVCGTPEQALCHSACRLPQWIVPVLTLHVRL